MRFHFRKTWKPGPFRISITEKFRPTWGIRAGRYGYDPKTGKHSFDTPGLGWVRSSGRPRSSRRVPVERGRSPVWGVLGLVVVVVVVLAIVVL
jgi:hypothetical protein